MPEARHLSPGDRIDCARSGYQKKGCDLSRRVAFEARFVKAMADASVPIVTGGDAPSIPGLVPGFALHGEIDAMLAAGLTPGKGCRRQRACWGSSSRSRLRGGEVRGRRAGLSVRSVAGGG